MRSDFALRVMAIFVPPSVLFFTVYMGINRRYGENNNETYNKKDD
jgi:hypothetical protein